MISLDRGPVTLRDGLVIYNASSLGSCVRALMAARVGFPPQPWPEVTKGYFEEGRVNEPRIIEVLERAGWEITHTGEGQLELDLPVMEGVIVRCHPDGLARARSGKEYVLEVKSFGKPNLERLNAQGLPGFPRYAWQTSVESAVTGLPCLFVVGDKTTEPIETSENVFPTSYTREQIIERVLLIESMARKEGLPPCDVSDYPCPFFYLHEDQDKESWDGMAALEALGQAYVEARDVVKMAETKRSEAGGTIKSLLERDRLDKARTPSFLFSYTPRRGRESVDVEAMKADGVWEKYVRCGELTKILTVSRRKL